MKTLVLSADNVTLEFDNIVKNIDISNFLDINLHVIRSKFYAKCLIKNYYNNYDLSLLISLKYDSFDKLEEKNVCIDSFIFKEDKKITTSVNEYLNCLDLQGISIDYTNIKLLYLNELNEIINNLKNLLLINHKIEYNKFIETIQTENIIKISSENVSHQKENINNKVKLFIAPSLSFDEIIEKYLNISNMTYNITRHINFNISFEYNKRIYSGIINKTNGKFECGSIFTDRDINTGIYFNKRLSSINLNALLKNIVNKTIEYETNYYNQQERISNQYKQCLNTKEFLITLIPKELINIYKYTEERKYPLPGQSRYIDVFSIKIEIKNHKYIVAINDEEILFNGLYLTKYQFEQIIKILLQE